MKWDETVDVLIVGSGVAGLSAAIESAKTGASVVVLEKMKITGGNSRISDGGLSAAGNFLQKKLGLKDSPGQLKKDMLKAGRELNHPHLVDIVAEQGAAVNEERYGSIARRGRLVVVQGQRSDPDKRTPQAE